MSPLERKTSTEVEDESVALVSHPKPVKRKRNASSSIPQPKSKRMKPDNWNTKHMEWIRKNYPDLVTQHAKSRVGWFSNLPQVLFQSPRYLTERERHEPNGNEHTDDLGPFSFPTRPPRIATQAPTEIPDLLPDELIDENNSNHNSRTQEYTPRITTHAPTEIPDLLPDEPITRNTENGNQAQQNPQQRPGNRTQRSSSVLSSSSSSARQQQFPHPRRVTFAPYDEIRTYTIVLGDHPLCKDGFVIALGDVYSVSMRPVTHQEQEPRAVHRRDYSERKELLLTLGGYTKHELRAVMHTTMPNTGGGFKSEYTSEPLSDFMIFYTAPSTSPRIASNSYESRIDTTVPKTPDMNGIVSIPRSPTTPKSKGCGSNKTTTTELELRARMEAILQYRMIEAEKGLTSERRVLRAPQSNGCGSNKTTTGKTTTDKTVSYCIHGGNILGQANANAIPTDEDAQAVPYYTPKCKIVEGGILDCIQCNARELDDNERNKITDVVGTAFATDADMDTDDDMDKISHKAAKVAHSLINGARTEIVKIMYTHKDPQSGKTMIALAGVIILSRQTALWAHDTTTSNPEDSEVRYCSSRIKVYNMVQICILPEYRMRNLGHIAMVACKEIAGQFGADFLWWVGVEWAYYDRFGWKKNPEMINLPFSLGNSETDNRKMFYYMEIGNKFQEEVTKFYNEDPKTRYYSLTVENKDIQEYYGSYDKNRDVKRPMTHTFKEKLSSRYTRHDGHTINIIIESTTAYDDFKFSITSKNITINGQRKDKMGNTHKYNSSYAFEKSIQGYKCTGKSEGENFVITIEHN